MLGLALWATIPLALGWTVTTVVTGSMEPAISTGDLVVSRPIAGDKVVPGQVALVTDPDRADRLRLHRMVRTDDAGALILKGDANPNEDSSPVAPDAVQGVGVLRVPWIGLPITWAKDGNVIALGGVATGLAGLLYLAQGHQLGSRRGRLLATSTSLLGVTLSLVTPASARDAHAALSATTDSAASFTAAAPAYRDLVIGDGPIAYYEAETADPTVNSAPNPPATTTNYGLTTKASDLRPDSTAALDLSKDRTYMTLNAMYPDPGPQVFTMEFWFKANPGAPGGRIVGFGSNGQAGDAFFYDREVYMLADGRLQFGYGSYSPHWLQTASAYNDGKWHYVVASRSDSEMRFTVDGTSLTGPAGRAQTYSGYWRVGWDKLDGWPNDPRQLAFAGVVDDMAIYHKTLSGDQIQAHYQAGRG
ncbi:hypothetical protein GCM10027298_14480 [Epidermidibacterium keratini]